MDPVGNFSVYRSALAKAIGQADAASEGPHSWVVPFFSLIVKDIYFLHQGKKDRDEKGNIQFDKCMALARLVSQILSYKDRVVSAHTLLPNPVRFWSDDGTGPQMHTKFHAWQGLWVHMAQHTPK